MTAPPAPSLSPAPGELLAAEDLRVDVGGTPACDGLTFAIGGERALVLGAPRALTLAAAGLLPVARGKLEVRGRAPCEALRARLVACAASDPPLPSTFTPLSYATWSARLAGLPKVAAARSAEEALTRLELTPMAKTPIGRLAPPVRRGIVVAAALATGAPLLLLEEPLAGLPDEIAQAFGEVLVRALAQRAWIVFAGRLALTSALARHADVAVIASASRIEAHGPPATLASASRRYAARLDGGAAQLDALLRDLEQRGVGIVRQGGDGGHAFGVELGEAGSTAELVAACARARVAIVELLPVARALV